MFANFLANNRRFISEMCKEREKFRESLQKRKVEKGSYGTNMFEGVGHMRWWRPLTFQ